jgi:PilZ domain-containing protein
MLERRRCERFRFTIPVKVYGRTPRNHPFRDVTATMAVSLYGGLLDMKPRVKPGQKILVVNSFTDEERECRVVYVASKQRGRRRVAVEFANVDGDFWHVYSPPVPLKPAPPPAMPMDHEAI